MVATCVLHSLGLIEYRAAWQLQERLAGEIARGLRPPTLLLLQHPHTYTFGRRGHASHLLWDESECQRRGIAVHWVDRGGDITYHGPGQLVGYPLLPLSPLEMQVDPLTGQARLPQADYVGYVRRLEAVLVQALVHFGVDAGQEHGLTGVWAPDSTLGRAGDARAKVAAIGVKVDARGISRHGFALNVNPDMSYWDGIIGCGLKDARATSLALLLEPPPAFDEVAAVVADCFGQVFGYEMVADPHEERFF